MAGDAELSSGDAQSEHERKRDRQMIELFNELRIALPGVQVLRRVWAAIIGLWFVRPLYRRATRD